MCLRSYLTALAAVAMMGAGCGKSAEKSPPAGRDAGVETDGPPAEHTRIIYDAAVPDAAAPRRVSLVAVGDILFARYLPDKTLSRVSERRRPFADVAHILERADIVFGNVESPVTVQPKKFSVFRTLTFRAEPGDMRTLAAAGFDVVSLANNHAYDMGIKRVAETRRNVEAAGLVAIGAGATEAIARRPGLIEKNGIRIAILAWTVWLKGQKGANRDGAVALVRNRHLRGTLGPEIARVRRELSPDFVVVSLHWGIEYEPHPGSTQRRNARALIDAGADLILGHHPHVVQDFERYKHGIIVYSLGNFLFDNPELRQRRSAIFAATFEVADGERRISEAIVHPVVASAKTHLPRSATSRKYRSWHRALRKLAPDIPIAVTPKGAPQRR